MGEYIVEDIFNKKDRRYIITKSTLNKAIVPISGAKNSALPILIASALTNGDATIANIPVELNDVQAVLEILQELGCSVVDDHKLIHVNAGCLRNGFVTPDIASKTRYSSLLMGLLLGKYRSVRVPLPGGCKLGDGRPLDIHFDGLEALGAHVAITDNTVSLEAPAGLNGALYALKYPSVGATENLLIAASTAKGTTVLNNCACEPEVSDLAIFLNKAGARIKGIGTRQLAIEGVEELHGCSYCIVPDRIEVGTFIGLCAVGRSKAVLVPTVYEHVSSIVDVYRGMGVGITAKDDLLEIDATGDLRPVDILTDTYPAVPTDMQPIFAAVLSTVAGRSTITETVFRNRFAHVPELRKLGAHIDIDGQKLIIEGNSSLSGNTVYSHDLRAGASLLLASVISEGTTEILNVQQIERGYSRIVDKFKRFGVNIEVI